MLAYKYSIRAVTLILLFMLFTFPLISAVESKQDDIIGVWLIEDKGEVVEKIEIYKCGEMYCGKIIWIKKTDSTETIVVDKKNKNKDLRNRPLLGLEVLKNYKFDGKSTWRNGKFYAHRKGRTVSPKLTLIDKNHLKIQVKILFVKKSFVWKRELLKQEI